MSSMRNEWIPGLQNLDTLLGSDPIKLRRILWVYFQNTYNSTYVAVKGIHAM